MPRIPLPHYGLLCLAVARCLSVGVALTGLSACTPEQLALLSELETLPSGWPSGQPAASATPASPSPDTGATPSPQPSLQPSSLPTAAPSTQPSASPSAGPDPLPTVQPTPTAGVTPVPTPSPQLTPTANPEPPPLYTPAPTPVPTQSTPVPTPVPTPLPSPLPSTGQLPLGVGASLQGRLPFPADNAWNQPVDHLAVDPNSDNLIASIGLNTGLHPDFGANWNGGPFGIPYVVVGADTPKLPIVFTDYGDESDPGPYPVPAQAPIEGGANASGDRHILVVDADNWKLYELFNAYPRADGGYNASSGAVFDLSSNAQRPAGWTSADAAGLPIFPGLVRYDEVVEQGEIRHALRFTVSRSRKAYVAPARHYASSRTDLNLPPMGMRVRLKANYEIAGFPPEAQVILRALKKYGMIVADNGSNWYISGAPDSRWNDSALNTLKQVKGSAFEVVEMGPVVAP